MTHSMAMDNSEVQQILLEGQYATDEELSDAKLLSKDEVLFLIENLTVKFLNTLIHNKEDLELTLVNRTERNVKRDSKGCVHLGESRTRKRFLSHRGAGSQRYAKIWQVIAMIQKVLQAGKMITQREAYYTLVQHFKNQSEFNDVLQDVIALTGVARASLGICASSSGGIAGQLLWKELGGDWEDCTLGTAGKRIPGIIEHIQFRNTGARYILVVEKDAVFTYLCGQHIWDRLPCILITGCGYPPLSVRSIVKLLSDQFRIPVIGLFDYNPHGIRILLTYKFGSTRMGTESHAYAVDIKWLGVHSNDLFDQNDQPIVPSTSLQSWSIADQRVYSGLSTVKEYMGDTFYGSELDKMNAKKVKAEIEAINTNGLDMLEKRIIHKILHKEYH